MQNPCEHLLASTGRSDQQGGDVGLCDFLSKGQQVLAGRVHKDDLSDFAARRFWIYLLGGFLTQLQPLLLAHVVECYHGPYTGLCCLYGQFERLSVDATVNRPGNRGGSLL